MLVSQNTKLVRGCVFEIWFLTALTLSLNGLKFTVLFTPLACCSECSWRFMITRAKRPSLLKLWVFLHHSNFNFFCQERWRVDVQWKHKKPQGVIDCCFQMRWERVDVKSGHHQRCCIRCLCLSLRYRPEPEEMFGSRVFFRMRFKMDIQNNALVAMINKRSN